MSENNAAGRIAIIYAIFGCLWILFSDQLLALLLRDPKTMLLVSEFKGWGFIILTAVLLYWLIRDSREELVRSAAELQRKSVALSENREKLLRYELLASHSRDVILFLRRDDGRILEANAAAVALYGYELPELLAMTIDDLRADDTREQTAHQLAEADDHGLLFETVHRRKDGSTFPVEVSSQGATIGDTRTLVSVIRDISQRHQYRAQLEKSRRDLLAILDNLPFLAWLKDAEGRFIAVNKPFAAACGLSSPAEVVGKTDLDIWPKELALGYQADDREVIASRQRKIVEEVVSGPAGPRWHQTFKSPLFDLAGTAIGTTGIAQDISERKATQEALQASEQRWRQLAEAMPQLVWTCTPRGDCDYLSRQWEVYTGHDEAEQLGSGWLERVNPDDRAALVGTWKRAVENGTLLDTEFRIRRHDGAYRWFKTRALPVRDATGQVVKWYGSNTDIHDLRTTQQALQEIEEQHRLALAAARLGTWRHDLQTDLIRLDQLARTHYAIDREELPLPDLLARVHPDDLERLRQEIAVSLDPGQPANDLVTEYRCLLADGTLRWLAVHVSVHVNGTAGDRRARYAIGTTQDITERKMQEERTAHLASFPQLNPNPVLEADLSGRVCFCNETARRILLECGLTEADTDQLLPADLERIITAWDKSTTSVLTRELPFCGRWYAETIYLNPQFGLVRIYGYEITELKRMQDALQQAHDDLERRVAERTAELAGALKSLQDETVERLRAVEALRDQERLMLHQSRLAAVGEMIGNIAHQWRQPLNSLSLLIQHAKLQFDSSRMTSEEAAETNDQAMALIAHMSRTIDDFRNFFRPDREKTEFSIHEAVARAVCLIEDSLRELQIGVEVTCEGNCKGFGFPNEYSQVLLNILINARDAFAENPCAEPRIRIRAWCDEGRSMVTITDNAGGIPPAFIDRIFEPYFSTKGVQGTGIGLYMAKTIIEKNMQGSLTAANTADGAQFRIEI